jgi:F420-non-reducing hydrogenase large subunit
MRELAHDDKLLDPEYRVLPTATPTEGVGVVEVPRGTLIHHYQTDERGVVQRANLIVATQNNAARMAMSVEKAAKGLIHGGHVPAEVLNKIELAFRAYDPCNGLRHPRSSRGDAVAADGAKQKRRANFRSDTGL